MPHARQAPPGDPSRRTSRKIVNIWYMICQRIGILPKTATLIRSSFIRVHPCSSVAPTPALFRVVRVIRGFAPVILLQ